MIDQKTNQWIFGFSKCQGDRQEHRRLFIVRDGEPLCKSIERLYYRKIPIPKGRYVIKV